MAVKEGLLTLLADRERYGYELKSEFEAATGGAWRLNVGQVYTTLDRLERDGLVEVSRRQTDNGEQKRYQLTASGRERLAAWWEESPGAAPPPRDELTLKVLMAVTYDHQHALDLVTRLRSILLGVLQQHRRNVRGARGDLATHLVNEAFVMKAEADLRWLDQCEAQLLKATKATTRGDTA